MAKRIFDAAITRRQHLTGLAGLVIASGSGALGSVAPARVPETAGINSVARAGNRRFGSTFAWGRAGSDTGSFANPAYAALLERDCGILVPENELKWQAIRPAEASYDFSRFDAMLDYAEAKGLAMRGHTLLWYDPKFFPAWLTNHDFGTRPVHEASRILTDHIRTVTRRYGRRIVSYDVVNEAIEPKTGELRRNSLANAVGNDTSLIDLAFHTAREALPDTQLVYNDYMSWEGGENITHRAGVLRLLEGFKARGVPVDALGVQSHIGVFSEGSVGDLVRRQTPEWRSFLDAVVQMGYKLVITEFDVTDTGLPGDVTTRDHAVADYARAYLGIMLDYPHLSDVLVWGMCDKYSWLQGFRPRPDRLPQRPCPYDSGFAAKPMRNALLEAFVAARR